MVFYVIVVVREWREPVGRPEFPHHHNCGLAKRSINNTLALNSFAFFLLKLIPALDLFVNQNRIGISTFAY